MNGWGNPRMYRSPTARLSSWPIDSSVPAASMVWLVGSRPTSSVTAKAADSCPSGTNTDAFGCIPASSRPGIAHSINSTGQRSNRGGFIPRLRDLFSFKPDLVLYDITSTYFEGAGPENFAKHGHSRDGKPHNVQVVVGVVMVAGWPIAHHVWPGNRIDHNTVQEVVGDLKTRFGFGRIVFVGDRGMVTAENIKSLKRLRSRVRHGSESAAEPEAEEWLGRLDETKWIDCPAGINAQERKSDPPRTRAQEVASGNPDMRVFIIDSDERRAIRTSHASTIDGANARKAGEIDQSSECRAIKVRDKIIKAAERILGKNHGQRYYAYDEFPGHIRVLRMRVVEQEKQIEGKYVIATGEKSMGMLEAVAIYKDLADVERDIAN